MEFNRVRIKGKQQRTYKEWRSDCGNYRIYWRNEFAGVSVTPCYYSLVKTECHYGDYWWNFAGHMGSHKSYGSAVEDCETNRKLWAKFIELSNAPGRRHEPLQELVARGGNVLKTMPVYVRRESDPVLIRMLFPPPKPCKTKNDHDDVIEASTPSDEADFALPPPPPVEDETPSDSMTLSGSLARSAEDEDEFETPTNDVPLKATSSPVGTPAEASAPMVEAPAKKPSKRTAKKSPDSKPTSKPTKRKKPSAKAASASSRKKKE